MLGNYLEIGNALPYRKNGFQELFGLVIVIKSVMENLAGKCLFCAGKALPRPFSGVRKSLPFAQSAGGGSDDSEFGIKSVQKIIPVKIRSSELNR